MELKLYDETDLRDSQKGSTEYPLEFIANLADDNIVLFGELDNLNMGTRIKDAGVVGPRDCTDPESACYYIYFKNRSDGRCFIKRLNEYIMEKARLVREAEAF